MASFLDNFTVLMLLDKLLLVGIVCGCTMIFKRETTLRILYILAAVTLLWLVASASGLQSTASFFDNLLKSAPIIISVIFQSDIKRALFSLWKNNSQSDGDVSDLSSTVEELSKGLHELADRRIGALIVIIRQMVVDHLVQVGTEIDAKVTSELLNSIFLPYSPIHDGAVIIQRDKIISAGCILPLSQNPDIAKSFGTRHRAALGISEQTDVLVLVVSEETGKISIVHEGKITYDADPAEIRRLSRKAIEGRRAARVVVEH